MTPTDLRLLCTALGFSAVIMRDRKTDGGDDARRAVSLANLIEEFCRVSVPDAFMKDNENSQVGSPVLFAPEKN